MRRRPTKRVLFLLGVGGLLMLAGGTAQAGWLFVLSAGVFALVVASVVVRHRLSAVAIERTVPSRIRVGDDVRVGLKVTNAGRSRLPLMWLTDELRAFEPATVAADSLPSGGIAHVELVRRALRRGIYTSGRIVVSSGAPFGLTRSTRITEVETPLVVVPRGVELRSFPLLEPSSFPSEVLHERARTGGGQEYLGVREYRPGDPRRAVHWRSSARLGRLVVREFEEESATRVVIVIAGGDHGEPPDSSFEALVSAAASIGSYALVTGHPLEIVRATKNGDPERVSGPERIELLEWLAGVESLDSELGPLVDTALAAVGRRGTVVICADGAGATGRSLRSAVEAAQGAGSRVIPVVTRSETWDVNRAALSIDGAFGGGRAPVRTLEKGKDLLACLTG